MCISRKIMLLILSTLLLFPLNPSNIYSKDYIPKQRIVTLIYDDSGSMRRDDKKKPIDNWKYANYALQSLVGLLDSNDLLYVIPMSNPKEAMSISLGKDYRQAQINTIGTWDGQSGTPIETIYTAKKQITELTANYPDAEYWMILLTDGVFEELYPNDNEDTNPIEKPTKKRMDTERDLTDFTLSMQEKGLSFNSALVTIESYLTLNQKQYMGDFKQLWETSTKGSTIESDNEESIVDSINKVAALITNRDPDESKIFDLHAKYSNSGVTLESPFPLRRITVLNQSRDVSSSFSINEVAFNGQVKRDGIEGPYIINSPIDPNHLSPPIQGSISHIKQGDFGEVLPEGVYELHFLEEITEEQKRNIRFLAEPAVDFNITVNKLNPDGSITNDESTFFADSNMLLDVELIQSETKKPITLDTVNKNIFKITATVDEQPIQMVWDENRKVFTANVHLSNSEEITTKVTVQIEGLYQKDKTLTIKSIPIRNLELKRNDDSPWSIKVDQLEKGKSIEIIPLVNGSEMTKEELKEVFSNVSVSSDEYQIEYDLNQKDNHIMIKPKLNKKSVVLTSTGEIPVHVTIKGKYPKEFAELDFNLNVQDIPMLKKYGMLLLRSFLFLLLLAYLFGIYHKPRFAKDRISLVRKKTTISGNHKIPEPPSTVNFKTNLFQRWLIPYMAEKKTIYGLDFKATRNKHMVLLLKQSLSVNMYIAGEKLSEGYLKEDKHIGNNDEIKRESNSAIEIYTFKSN
jgi:hypothetical protein